MYFQTRFVHKPHRSKAWEHLAKYFSQHIPDNSVVLEVGAGYCDFINSVAAKHKFAIDIEADFEIFAAPEVVTFVGNAVELGPIKDHACDVIFASNFLEHLYRHESDKFLENVRRCLKPSGKLILMQPNFRYSYKHYFDDYTHVSIFSHESLSDYLGALGFEVLISKKKFLPLTLKSRLSNFHFLIPIYLRSPWKPRAGQMMLVAKLRSPSELG